MTWYQPWRTHYHSRSWFLPGQVSVRVTEEVQWNAFVTHVLMREVLRLDNITKNTDVLASMSSDAWFLSTNSWNPLDWIFSGFNSWFFNLTFYVNISLFHLRQPSFKTTDLHNFKRTDMGHYLSKNDPVSFAITTLARVFTGAFLVPGSPD